MNIIKKTLQKLFRWVLYDDEAVYEKKRDANIIGMSSKSTSLDEVQRAIHFTIYPASGGKVVQSSSYDQKIGQTRTNLYIVTDKDDLGEELAQIITRETLSH